MTTNLRGTPAETRCLRHRVGMLLLLLRALVAVAAVRRSGPRPAARQRATGQDFRTSRGR